MRNTKALLNRRQFVQSCGSGALLLACGCAPLAAKQNNKIQLASRKNASLLALNYNENSLGMSPKAVAAAQRATELLGNRYPDEDVEALRTRLGKINGVDPEQIILGNGSTEVIQAVVTVAAGRGATVVEPAPTFGDVRRYAAAEGLTVVRVPVSSGFVTNIAKLREAANQVEGTVLVNICNPNNPTGTIVEQKLLFEWINAAADNQIFLIDEAYYEYAQLNQRYTSALPLIQAGTENLIVARTFSKIYGMAGMRVGYGIAAPTTAKDVRKFSAGFNLSAAGTAAALASLDDSAFFAKSRQSNLDAKRILLKKLDDLGLQHIESNTNFVLHRINSNLSDYASRMRLNGIRVGRRMTVEDGWNRISLGTPDEMLEFTRVLDEFRARGWV